MFKSILVPIDLADTDLAKPAIATAATLSQTWNGAVRLLNVLPMTPVMLAEYVPADFDTQQRETSRGSARDRRARIRHRGVAHFHRGAAGRHLSRDPRRGRGDQGRPDRDDVAPAGDAHLFPRLQRRPCRALRQMLGAGGAALSDRLSAPPPDRIQGKLHRARTPLQALDASPDAPELRIDAAVHGRFDLAALDADVAERTIVQFAQRFDGFAARQIGQRCRSPGCRAAEKSARQVSGSRLACGRGNRGHRHLLLRLASVRQSGAAGANAATAAAPIALGLLAPSSVQSRA